MPKGKSYDTNILVEFKNQLNFYIHLSNLDSRRNILIISFHSEFFFLGHSSLYDYNNKKCSTSKLKQNNIWM